MTLVRTTLRDPYLRFLTYVQLGDGCWIWGGDVGGTTAPYGRFWYRGKTRRAHKWLWEFFNGPVPEDLVLHHMCEVKVCVRPDHLEATTSQGNTLASDTLARRNALKTHCKRGHEFSEANTRTDKRGSRVCKTCMRQHRKNWKERHASDTP